MNKKGTDMNKIRVGIVGSAGRGASFKQAFESIGELTVQAVCDTNVEKLEESRRNLDARESYAEYGEMVKKADIQAVIIGTPMPFHVPQAIDALNRGLHVLSEVPAGVSVAECRELVATANRSKAVYMMAENFTYMKPNVLIRELVRRGMFGETYYAEGEYIHELKAFIEGTPWRLHWQTGINGVTYGTHSLGPILQWMPGDRVVSVCCAGSGHHFRDPRGDLYENEDSCVMLCKMAKGGLVKIRVDMLSDRPHSMINYQLQGADGAYESARDEGGKNRIWLRGRGAEHTWSDLAELEAEFLPEDWRKGEAMASKAGHWGGDYFEILDFLGAITGRKPCPIGIHEAMDMTLPGLVSQESIAKGGCWLPVPDSRTW
ncbi:MAG: Gfo/Idh/MocA family oxidoreductase [Kiritimatiellae bacterium]|nr:Gfo/Idh/MocA family oxidoreductase [Kiritimatiellia bacterium]